MEKNEVFGKLSESFNDKFSISASPTIEHEALNRMLESMVSMGVSTSKIGYKVQAQLPDSIYSYGDDPYEVHKSINDPAGYRSSHTVTSPLRSAKMIDLSDQMSTSVNQPWYQTSGNETATLYIPQVKCINIDTNPSRDYTQLLRRLLDIQVIKSTKLSDSPLRLNLEFDEYIKSTGILSMLSTNRHTRDYLDAFRVNQLNLSRYNFHGMDRLTGEIAGFSTSSLLGSYDEFSRSGEFMHMAKLKNSLDNITDASRRYHGRSAISNLCNQTFSIGDKLYFMHMLRVHYKFDYTVNLSGFKAYSDYITHLLRTAMLVLNSTSDSRHGTPLYSSDPMGESILESLVKITDVSVHIQADLSNPLNSKLMNNFRPNSSSLILRM